MSAPTPGPAEQDASWTIISHVIQKGPTRVGHIVIKDGDISVCDIFPFGAERFLGEKQALKYAALIAATPELRAFIEMVAQFSPYHVGQDMPRGDAADTMNSCIAKARKLVLKAEPPHEE